MGTVIETGTRTKKGRGWLGNALNQGKLRERTGDTYFGQQATSATRLDARANSSNNKRNQMPWARRQEKQYE